MMATTAGVPRPPPPLPPVSSRAKDYSADRRPAEVTDELDDLRTRGIAKVVNRHFTERTAQLAKEKAEADAALADLERRRAQTSEFRPSKGGEGLNPFDSLYVELQQRRAECRRKERETMLLYQRYVMKYGKAAKAGSPPKKAAPAASHGNGVAELKEEEGEEEKLINQSLRMKSNKSDPPGKAALDTLDENSSQVSFSKYYQKQLDKRGGGGGGTAATNLSSDHKEREEKKEKSTKQFMSALTKFMSEESQDCSPAVVGAEEEDETRSEAVSDLTLQTSKDTTDGKSVDDGTPPATGTLAPKVDKFTSAVSHFMAPHQEVREEDTDKDEEGPGGEDGNEMKAPANDQMEASDDQAGLGENSGNGELEVAPAAEAATALGKEDEDLNPDIETPSVPETDAEKWTPQQDPPDADAAPVVAENEEGNARAALSEEPPQTARVAVFASDPPVTVADEAATGGTLPPTPNRDTSTNAAAVTPLTSEVINETPSFTTTTVDDGDDGDDRSIISGLTFNSAVTRQVMDEIETEMEDFIKTETAAIRRILDSQEEQSSTINMDFEGTSQSDSLSNLIGDESVRVAMKAEAMALEMQRILDEFAKEDASVVGDESEGVDENGTVASRTSSVLANNYPHPFEPTIPGAEWYVYFDDNYKREFYLEKRTKRTQWDPPNSVPSSRDDQSVVTSDDFLSDIHSVASSRGSLSRRPSRRRLYRKQRRKRRTRRLLMSFFALVCVLVCVFHWRLNYPEKAFSAAMTATLATFLASLKHDIDTEKTKTYIVDQFEYAFTDRRMREEAEALRIQADVKARQEQRARELAARKAKEEDERRAFLEAERKAREKATQDEAARKVAARREATIQEEARRAAEQHDKQASSKRGAKDKKRNEHDPNRRPWACNIPFSYVHPRCYKILKVNPIYDDEVMIFLQ